MGSMQVKIQKRQVIKAGISSSFYPTACESNHKGCPWGCVKGGEKEYKNGKAIERIYDKLDKK